MSPDKNPPYSDRQNCIVRVHNIMTCTADLWRGGPALTEQGKPITVGGLGNLSRRELSGLIWMNRLDHPVSVLAFNRQC